MIIIPSPFMAKESVVGQGLLINETSRSDSDTALGRLLWSNDQPDAKTNNYTVLYENLRDVRVSIYLAITVFHY
jgi:hypothetical protein